MGYREAARWLTSRALAISALPEGIHLPSVGVAFARADADRLDAVHPEILGMGSLKASGDEDSRNGRKVTSQNKKALRWNPREASVLLDWKDGAFEYGIPIASPDHHPTTLALFEPGDLVMPARIAVARIVNEQLAKLASPQLLWSEQARRFGIYLRPKNLLGAMWVQFAQIVDERKIIAGCEVCGTWFEKTRKDRRHCSDRCRVRAMRKRKEGKK